MANVQYKPCARYELWEEEIQDRQDEDRKVDSFVSGVVYQSSCDICHPAERDISKDPARGMDRREGTYTGETNRSVFKMAGGTLS
jgi:hypothetical protein